VANRDRKRYRLGFAGVFSFAAFLLCSAILADDPELDRESAPVVEFDSSTKEAIRKGLEHLANTQESDGSWRDIIGRRVNFSYIGKVDKHVGVTALACMTFMAGGSLPGRGPYGKNVEKGLEFILSCVDENGYITFSESRMYSHAFATLFLAEVYGMTGRNDVGVKLREAVKAIVRAQNSQGAWRYKPDSQDSDISVTVCQIMALRAARNCGVAVPPETIRKAIEYVRKSAAENGRFYYQIYDEGGFSMPSRTSLALTAAGVVALQGAGEYDAKEVKAGLRQMFDEFVVRDAPLGTDRPENFLEAGRHTFDYFYCHYYAIQAMFQAGGNYWSAWWSKIRSQLVRLQYSDGRWEDLVGPNYATAMATLILQIPLQYLPIFQR
jgi:hypothetical protein